jgi:2,3-bisphosphoglycerate-dependent phosphoglycerate mutase
MELLLIRHALPIRRELEAGVADPDLADLGHAQAKHLADYLSSERLHAVYTSPMRRAVQTGAPVAAAHQLDPVTVDGVAEWDRNAPEYVPVEELKATNDPRWQAMLAGEWTSDESQESFQDRVLTSIETLISMHRGERIAVVCHGGVINSYLCHVLGMPDEGGFFYPNYTSIHRIAAASSGERSIVTINETSHLRNTGLPMGLFQQG